MAPDRPAMTPAGKMAPEIAPEQKSEQNRTDQRLIDEGSSKLWEIRGVFFRFDCGQGSRWWRACGARVARVAHPLRCNASP